MKRKQRLLNSKQMLLYAAIMRICILVWIPFRCFMMDSAGYIVIHKSWIHGEWQETPKVSNVHITSAVCIKLKTQYNLWCFNSISTVSVDNNLKLMIRLLLILNGSVLFLWFRNHLSQTIWFSRVISQEEFAITCITFANRPFLRYAILFYLKFNCKKMCTES